MEGKTLPMDKENNMNENLINPQTNQNIINPKSLPDQYIVGPINLNSNKVIIPTEPYYLFVPVLLVISLLLILFCSIPFIQLFWPLIFFHIFSFIFSILFCYKKTFKKLEVIKDETNNIISINSYNYFHCLYKQMQLKNINFYFGLINDDKENNHFFYRLFIMKNFDNSPEIDLNLSNIKTTPLQLYYYFDHIWPNKQPNIENRLNNLVGNPDYECPFKFDIDKYMSFRGSKGEKIKKLNPLFQNTGRGYYSQYLKFCDNYFCYYLEEPFSNIKADILRIDIIYSKDFSVIFIGLVNNNEKSYLNTFEFNMLTIDKFILEKIMYEDTGFNLKVIFKDQSSQQIYFLKKAKQKDLRGLVYILNERLNININNNQQTIEEENPPPLASADLS